MKLLLYATLLLLPCAGNSLNLLPRPQETLVFGPRWCIRQPLSVYVLALTYYQQIKRAYVKPENLKEDVVLHIDVAPTGEVVQQYCLYQRQSCNYFLRQNHTLPPPPKKLMTAGILQIEVEWDADTN